MNIGFWEALFVLTAFVAMIGTSVYASVRALDANEHKRTGAAWSWGILAIAVLIVPMAYAVSRSNVPTPNEQVERAK